MSNTTKTHPFDNPEVFVHPRETWDEAKCAKFVKHRQGYNEPYGGMLKADSCPYASYGNVRYYNGGTIEEDKWYRGVVKPMPIVPYGYVWVHISSWGIYLRKNDKDIKQYKPLKIDNRGMIVW